ncbi:MAG: BadF/BadG/BcrA/BcrD ATPase family protein, partial [Desulfosalsimonas sp.]
MTMIMQDPEHRNTTPLVLGLDAGSVSAGLAVLTPDREILHSDYRFHHGQIAATLEKMLASVDPGRLAAVCLTHSTPQIIDGDWRCDDRVAVIAAARFFHDKIGAILHVGGEKFSLMRFDKLGGYAGLETNTSCAAGTGSFLDQQAGRLNLSGISELARIAADNAGSVPKIASRCAVFAKTDLIHAQQEGYSLAEICDGLCRGLARNIVDTVFKHHRPNAPVIFCGGVARNPAVTHHISEMTGIQLVVDETAPLYGAVGTALSWIEENWTGEKSKKAAASRVPRPVLRQADFERTYGHPPLVLEHSRYPDFKSLEAYIYKTGSQDFASDVEVDIYARLEPERRQQVYLGMDIGSTSTKAVWLTPEKQVIAGFYTRTAGRPVAALCSVLEAMDDLVVKKDLDLRIAGAGTTGSGRKFV